MQVQIESLPDKSCAVVEHGDVSCFIPWEFTVKVFNSR